MEHAIKRLVLMTRYAIAARPMPHWLTAIYLSIRWCCYVPLDCRIYFPFRVRIGNSSRFYGRVTLIADGPIEIGSNVEIYEGALLQSQGGAIRIGSGSAIGPHVTIYGGGKVEIGRQCSIAAKCTIVSTNHIYKDPDRPIREQGFESKPIHIEDDVWLCAGVVIGYGARVGHGAIIAANSLVKKDIPSMTIAAGNPARPVKSRLQYRN